MNFDSLPLLRSPNGFYIFWLLTLSAIFSILCVFRWKTWL
jgi:Mg2+ and Co2+ transporter CorA